MHNESATEATTNRREQALPGTDQADCRNPQPRDPVAHPHYRLRPPVARRVVVDQPLESADEAGDFHQ